MLVILIILAILLVVFGFFIWNLMRKVEKYEDIAQYQQNYIENITTVIGESSKKLEEVDQKGSFQSDDEVGFFFNGIKEIQRILDEFNISETNGQKEEQS
jgi:predicted PurR-regulated permease PerM